MTAFQSFLRWHLVFLVGQLFTTVGLVMLFVCFPPQKPDPQLDRVLQVAVLLFAAAGYFGGSLWLFKKVMKRIHAMPDDVSIRFAAFRQMSIMQWAMLAGPYLFCWVSFLLTGNLSYPALAVFLFVFFLLLRPNALRTAIQLRVRESDLLQLT
jgi:hypothetical protein